MHKIIFLDIDGVLITQKSMMARHKAGIKSTIDTEFSDNIDRESLEAFQTLIKISGAKVVISSAWRIKTTIGQMKRNFRSVGLDFNLIVGYTSTGFNGDRGLQIKDYIEKNQVENFVIIDDGLINGFKNKQVHTDWMYGGFQNSDIQLALDILR